MRDHSIFLIFTSPLNNLNIRYIITGSVASIVYGEPRLTHDIDLVVELSNEHAERFTEAFPLDTFYCPPTDIIKLESGRDFRGHFNLVHHKTGFKADVYLKGRDPLHEWALKNRQRIEIESDHFWMAPIEYVILRKLEYYREGKSEKHIRDVEGILKISRDEIDLDELNKWINSMKLSEEWRLVSS